MKVTRIIGAPERAASSSAGTSRSCRTTTVRRPIASSTVSAPFQGYDSGDPTSREVGLYDQAFVDTYIHTAVERRRGSSPAVRRSLSARREGHLRSGQPGHRRSRRNPRRAPAPGKDVFTGFNIFSIALEVPITRHLPAAASRTTGSCWPNSTDSLLRVWSSISRQQTQTVDATNIITGLKGSGDWVQVGRNALPLFNAGLVGTQRQTLYLRTSPITDVTNFGADILFPVLVRDAEALGIYTALGVPSDRGDAQGAPRGHHQGDQPGPADSGRRRLHGDVITLDAAIDSSFPNGRRLGGGTRAEPQSGERQQRADQPDRRRRPGGRPLQRRRGQRQELPEPVPVPGSGASGSAPGARWHQRRRPYPTSRFPERTMRRHAT